MTVVKIRCPNCGKVNKLVGKFTLVGKTCIKCSGNLYQLKKLEKAKIKQERKALKSKPSAQGAKKDKKTEISEDVYLSDKGGKFGIKTPIGGFKLTKKDRCSKCGKKLEGSRMVGDNTFKCKECGKKNIII